MSFCMKIKEQYKESQYRTRIDKDVFITTAAKKNYNGFVDEAIKFVQENQLKKSDDWHRFTEQFRLQPDSEENWWRGEFWGKMMRGSCMVYKYTEDEELYKILQETVEELISLQDDDGRISSYKREHEFEGWDIWGRKYILMGFLHFYEICKCDELKISIMKAMKAHTDYIISHIGDEEGKIPIGETSQWWSAVNSHTILEPVVRLYNLSGEKRYLDFAAYIVNKGGANDCNLIELALDDTLYPYQYPVVKAYEIMSFFEGVIEYYRVTGEDKYKRCVELFAKKVIDSEITIIGSAGCTHELFDNSKIRQTDDTATGIMQETCVTVTWMKLCSQLLCLTGDSIYADCIETSMYNGLLGAINTENSDKIERLMFDSYSPLRLGARGQGIGGKATLDETHIYGCCASIGAAGMGLFPENSVLESEKGVVVNFYINGEAEIITPSNKLAKLKIYTLYPYDSKIKIKAALNESEKFEIALRIPAFSETSGIIVNGDKYEAKEGYCKVCREWKNGDTIEIILDMGVKIINSFAQNDYFALKKGPIVLARDARLGENIEMPINFDSQIKLEKSNTANFPVLCEYKVKMGNNEAFTMIDYSSAGKTMDEKSLTAAWLRKINR